MMAAPIDSDEPWAHRAACARLPKSVFFPGGEEAKAVCAHCPVTEECLTYALANKVDHGTWGAHDEHERRRLRRGHPDRTDWHQIAHQALGALPPPTTPPTPATDLVAVDNAFLAALDATSVLNAVEARLIASGAVVELQQLHRLSAAETDLLVRREIHQPSTPEEPYH